MQPHHRSPRMVAEVLQDVLRDKTACDLGCGEGDHMVSMARYAAQVIGLELDPRRASPALERGLDVHIGNYRVDELPKADVYYLWADRVDRDAYFMVHRLLAWSEFNGTIVIAEDSATEEEVKVVQSCAQLGELRNVPLDEGPGDREHGIFHLAVICSDQLANLQRLHSERRALVTLKIGDAVNELYDLVAPHHQAYADRVNAEYIVIDKPRIKQPVIFYEIFQIEALFDDFNRVMYIDLDAVPRPDCPDLFALVPPDRLGVHVECTFFEPVVSKDIQRCMTHWGAVDWNGDYFNNGVTVASEQHRGLFQVDQELPDGLLYSDQSVMNYRAAKSGTALFEIGEANHYLSFHRYSPSSDILKYANLVHFAGLPMAEKIKPVQELLLEWDKADWSREESRLLCLPGMFGGLVFGQVQTFEATKIGSQFELELKDRSLRLNETGMLILQACDGKTSVAEIIGRFSTAFDMPSETVRHEVIEGLWALRSAKVIRSVNRYESDRDLMAAFLPQA